jgi:hypothetical protein
VITPPDPPPGLRAVGPREWMNVWVRVIAAPSVKLVGVMAAHFADYSTGAEIRPGNELLAVVSGGIDKRTVLKSLAQIREWGLIWRYSEGRLQGRRGMADVYRLTIPEDALATIPMLDPDYRRPVDNLNGSGDLRSGDLRSGDLSARNR